MDRTEAFACAPRVPLCNGQGQYKKSLGNLTHPQQHECLVALHKKQWGGPGKDLPTDHIIRLLLAPTVCTGVALNQTKTSISQL